MTFIKRILCFIGIHWEGTSGLGMYGDAGKCDLCGEDAYGLFIVNDRSKK